MPIFTSLQILSLLLCNLCTSLIAMAVVELKVGMHCEKCIRTTKKAIKKIEDIETYKVDTQLKKITVTRNVKAEEVLRVLQKVGKTASYWSEEEQNPPTVAADGTFQT